MNNSHDESIAFSSAIGWIGSAALQHKWERLLGDRAGQADIPQRLFTEQLARKTIAEHLGVPEPLVLDPVEFRDLGADSLDIVELTLVLERAFDVSIADDDAQGCTNVGEALSILRAAVARRALRMAKAEGGVRV